MEVVGFVISVAGLAGLFGVCTEVLERVDAYRDYGITSNQLLLRFEAEKIRLQKWADNVGIKDTAALEENHHRALDDPIVCGAVSRTLAAIRDLFAITDDISAKFSQTDAIAHNDESFILRRASTWSTKVNKAKWSLGRESRFTKLVENLEVLVEKVHLLVSPSDDSSLEIGISTLSSALGGQEQMLKELRSLIQNIEKRGKLEDLHSLDKLLNPPQIPDQLDVHLATRLEGTCDWVLHIPVYQRWLNGDGSGASSVTRFLWLHGSPGTGKTILCSSIIDSLNRTHAPFVFHFFTSLYARADGRPEDIIRVWILQLARASQTAFQAARAQLDIKQFSTTVSSVDLWKTFNQVVSKLQRCVFIIDGFDEYSSLASSGEDFLIKLKKNLENTASVVLLTSRDEPEIRTQLTDDRTSQGGIKLYWHSISKEDNFADINLYSQHIVKQKLDKKDVTVRENVALGLAERCDGMFLWISMSGRDLRNALTKSQLERHVAKVPKGLFANYERTWQQILGNDNDDDRLRSLKILQWCSLCLRPLTVTELMEALWIELHDDNELELSELNELHDEIDLEDVISEFRSLCGSLVEVRHVGSAEGAESMSVQLNHVSVKEFWLSKATGERAITTQHAELAIICLRYLCHLKLESRNNSESSKLGVFRQYAIDHWASHYRLSDSKDGILQTLVIEFLCSESVSFSSWAQAFEDQELSEYRAKERQPGNPLYYAVLLGSLPLMTAIYVANKHYLDSEGGILGTALKVTCFKGTADAFEKLLEWGADVNHSIGLGGTALIVAAYHGRVEFVQKLLSRSAKIDLVDGQKAPALHLAAQSANYAVTKLLLDQGANIHLLDDGGWSALHNAVFTRNSSVDVVCLLLDHGADHTTATLEGETPLRIAASEGNIEIVRLLLSRNADIRASGNDGWTPLDMAIFNDHHEIACLLLNEGAPVDCTNTREDMRPLDIAASMGSLDLVRKLIDHGANVNSESKVTPLMYAAQQGNLAVATLLMDSGADVNAVDQFGNIPLDYAVGAGRVEVFQLLLQRGADITCHKNQEWNALHQVALDGSLEMVQHLIDRGQDIELMTPSSETPLSIAAARGHLEVVQYLLSKGANINAACLMAVARSGQLNIFDLLWEAQHEPHRATIDITTTDINGRNILHHAALGGNLEILNRVVVAGDLDITVADACGRNLLDHACMSGSLETVSKVLQLVNIDDQHHGLGWSPFHWACRKGSLDVLRLLKEANIPATVVNTSQPEISWSPLDIARYYGNSKLVSENGSLLESQALEELFLKDISSTWHILYTNSLSSGKKADNRYCDGCLEYIYGIFTRCLACHDEGEDYCLMCRHDLDSLHAGHEWYQGEVSAT